MDRECSVCKTERPQRNMKYLKPINDWICKDCEQRGQEENVTDLEDGKEVTAQIRGEDYSGE